MLHKIIGLLLACCLAGCGKFAPTPAISPIPLSQTLPSTSVPRVTPAPSIPPASPTPAPTTAAPPPPTQGPPSGWSVFSNPDFIRGLAIIDGDLWTATSGGVVRWNLHTHSPTLYTTRDGLAEIQANAVVACPMPDARVVVAHPTGVLSVFDPRLRHWSHLPVDFADGGTLHGIRTLFCDIENSRLLVGALDGLGILDLRSGVWQHIGADKGLKAASIRSITVVGLTTWVAAGDQGAYMITGNTVFPFNSASGFPSGMVNDVTGAPDASIWFGYSTGLVHYQDKKWNSYGGQGFSGIPFASVDQVVVGADKRVWVASATEGICPFDLVKQLCAPVYPSMPGAAMTALSVDADNVAYAGTEGAGVLVLHDDQVQHLAFQRQQLISNTIFDLAAGKDGRIWVATDRGVNVFDPARPQEVWQSITPRRKELAFARVSGLFPTANGMWLLYDQQPQVSLFSGDGNWQHLTAANGISAPVISAALDSRGYAWFATAQGATVWDGVNMRGIALPSDALGKTIRTLFADHNAVWVGTDRGLLRYERYQWQMVLPDVAINSIAADPHGGWLLGTDQGLVRYDGSQSYVWVINLGQEILENVKVTSLAWDRNQQLWIGTDGQGLLRFTGQRWEQFNTANGLPSNTVRKIVADRLGTIWAATTSGEEGGALVRYVP